VARQITLEDGHDWTSRKTGHSRRILMEACCMFGCCNHAEDTSAIEAGEDHWAYSGYVQYRQIMPTDQPPTQIRVKNFKAWVRKNNALVAVTSGRSQPLIERDAEGLPTRMSF